MNKKPDISPDSSGNRVLRKETVHIREGTIQIQYVAFADNNSLEHLHSHNAYEIYFCLEGILQLKVENTDYMLTKNQFIVVSPGLYHRVYYSVNIPSQNFMLLFQYQPGAQANESSFLSSLSLLLNSERRVLSGTDNYRARRAIEEISLETGEELAGSEELLHGYYLEVLTKVFRNFLPQIKSHNSMDEQLALAVQINSFIKEHHNEGILPQDVADAMHVTLRHADRVSNEFFGLTVMKSLQFAHLAYARQEIEKTSEPLDVIAEKSGYDSIDAMEKSFKKFEGMSPAEYRKLTQGKSK